MVVANSEMCIRRDGLQDSDAKMAISISRTSPPQSTQPRLKQQIAKVMNWSNSEDTIEHPTEMGLVRLVFVDQGLNMNSIKYSSRL